MKNTLMSISSTLHLISAFNIHSFLAFIHSCLDSSGLFICIQHSFTFIAFISKLHSFAFTHSFIYCSPRFVHVINAMLRCIAFMCDANTYISRVA